ncbi:MAG: ABC transporter ATP-binding protein [Nitrospirae bacterium]|nr:ABC transporter ATP-binding protein [Nitrospirota bacterium]
MIEVKNITFKYGAITVLDNISLSIEKGLRYALLGANGAGKTTLLLHLNGVLRPLSGKIFFNGEEITYDRKTLSSLRRRVGVVFQDPEVQLFSATVAEDVSFGPMNLGLSPEEAIGRVDGSLKACGIYELKGRPTHFLSHGEKKLAAIAGVLAMEPEVIVLDEPIAGIDNVHKEKILNIFSKLRENNVTLIMSTHNVDLAYEWADRIIVMDNAKIAGIGTPLEVFTNGKLSVSQPIVLEIYKMLIKCGLHGNNKDIPRIKDELLRYIEGAALKLPQGSAPP